MSCLLTYGFQIYSSYHQQLVYMHVSPITTKQSLVAKMLALIESSDYQVAIMR